MKTIWTFDTEYSADSVEFCPIAGYRHLFAVGTYQVESGEQSYTRLGRIYVADSEKKEIVQKVECNAVLDMKWSHYELHDSPILAQVTAKGETIISAVGNSGLNSVPTAQHIVDDCLILSVDFQNTVNKSFGHNLVISRSDGTIEYLKLTPDSLTSAWSSKSHDFEAWVAQFNYHDPNIIYSGGDDSLFKVWDLRGKAVTSKTHQAGVTSISHHPRKEFVLATGSYDESIRIWDSRSLKLPVMESNSGGGIWRLKWHPENDILLAACMYNGFQVYDNRQQLSLMQSNNNHNSIAYGADWSYTDIGIIGTCSFYDHLFSMWRCNSL